MDKIILEYIKSLRERYIKYADYFIFYELYGISNLILKFENAKLISVLASVNIKREIDSLNDLILRYEREKKGLEDESKNTL